MWFGIARLEKAGTSLKKTSSGYQHMLLKNLYVPFCINGAINNVQISHTMDINTLPHPLKVLAFELKLLDYLPTQPFISWWISSLPCL